jgi:mevalonate kinase
VIALERPILFTRRDGARPFAIARPFKLVIAHTGVATPTRITVGEVRRGWLSEPERYEALFDDIAAVVAQAQAALAGGANERLGQLMKQNQELLRVLGVSSPEIETLRLAAETAGAAGAKLSGGGRGGNVIVYAGEEGTEPVEQALVHAGAARVMTTTIG